MAASWFGLSYTQVWQSPRSTRGRSPVRKLEDELRLEKDVWLSVSLQALGLAGEVGEQDHEVETLVCCLAQQAASG